VEEKQSALAAAVIGKKRRSRGKRIDALQFCYCPEAILAVLPSSILRRSRAAPFVPAGLLIPR